jgi:hypothetical protein
LINSLGKIGPAARSAVPAILDILDLPLPPKPGPLQRPPAPPPYEAAIHALGKIGDDSDQVMSRLLKMGETGTVPSAVGADDIAASEMQQRIANSEATRRRLPALEALILICRQANHSDTVLPELIRALEDESGNMRLVAACLGQIQGDRTPAIPSLIKALDDGNPWVVSAAALSLRAIGPAAESAAPRLRKLTEYAHNRGTNATRVPPVIPMANLQFERGGYDLDRLSVTQAARLALEVVESPARP